ncbi:Voltage-gated hydrogen channel 1 [Geranomyces michiganensis]|nr:Voltage-gated hydrogen channel 1 [Geranomyces michiganensis]
MLTILKFISLAILIVFCFEHALRLFALGIVDYVHNPLHAFDAAVVYGSLVLELTLKGTAAEFAGLLIAARSWRIVRVIDNVATAVKAEKEDQLRSLKEENEVLKQELSAIRAATGWDSRLQAGQ